MFYLLNVRPGDARRAGIHDTESDHPLATLYDQLLKVAALQMIAGNPCLKPLLGEPSMYREQVLATWISLSHFVALVRSPLSPFQGLIEPPEGLKSLVASPSFTATTPSDAVAAYEMAATGRRPSPLPTANVDDASEGFFDSPAPVLQKKGDRYAYPTLGLLAELLEEIARGDREPRSVLDGERLDAKAVSRILHEIAASAFPKTLEFVKKPGTMAKHISSARNRLKTGGFGQ
ncbi:hypothetical protein EZ313_17315 [Ramlibacter henchirensis]|uniref:Uncharacterized protein n=1 Tax=Ramlibacter henchirensis TaxID=204072 RepID=A0A4Z0BW91_9BURK|nr:hypothetical protein EZ313_17315 [Ramlibacter henchirensis]